MFRKGDIVKLKKDDLKCGVLSIYWGTIVKVLEGDTYIVEFMDLNGDIIESAFDKKYKVWQLKNVKITYD